MKQLLAIITAALLGLTLVIGLAGCGDNQPGTPPGAAFPTPQGTLITQEAGREIALDFVRNSATFKFDGLANSLKITSSDYGPISAYRSFAYTLEFQTAHPGHGDRTGQMLAQVTTQHSTMLIVNAEMGVVGMAACDRTWDLVNEKVLPTFISGFVIGGGDTTSADGPRDAPRQFIFQVQKHDGTRVNVAYTAYPPSPVGEANRAKIKLEFYQTPVQPGDYLEAQGVLDAASNIIQVSAQGDFIRTSQRSSTVRGKVISGGDITLTGGPLDAPRIFVYKLQKDDGGFVDVTYTAYPPSSVGDANRSKIMFSLYDGQIKIGDYLKAQGFYDPAAGTLTVGQQGDFIKTYAAGWPVD